MRILVTGAHGCIGSWVLKGLLDRNVDVIALDLDANPVRLSLIARPEQLARLRMITGRIEDTAAIKSLVADEGITHVIHLAAVLMPFCQANPVIGGQINVIGTLNVFEAARDAGRPVRVVYASSAAVWGKSEMYGDRALTEDDPLKPEYHYGVFKRMNEENARVFWTTNRISSVGLRPWTVYGVGRDAGITADPTLALRAVALEQPFHIRLSGHMDFQFVEDVAESFIRCALGSFEGAHVFNLAGEIATVDEFVTILNEIDPRSKALITAGGGEVPVAFRISDERIRGYIPDLPKTPLRDGVARTLSTFHRLRAESRFA